MFQCMGVCIYIMLINNSLDKGSFVFGGFFCLMLYSAIIYSTYGFTANDSWKTQMPGFTFGVFCFIIFLNIQKKIHKDAFIEIK